MNDPDIDEIRVTAGPHGARLVELMSEQAIEAIKSFPASTPEARAAMARFVSVEMIGYAEEEEGL